MTESVKKEDIISSKDNQLRLIFEAVSCLHKRGLEKIRIMVYYTTSDCVRCVISIKDNFDKTGFVCVKADMPIFRCNPRIMLFENKTAEEIADIILEMNPRLEDMGKGQDSEYLSWYEKLLEVVREGKYPYAFENFGYDIYQSKQIRLTNGEWIDFPPPGTYKGDSIPIRKPS